MPKRTPEGTDVSYHLVSFDAAGNERTEDDGLLSTELERLVADGVTDVYLISHGWMGDVPAAVRQYDTWIGVMADQRADRARARELVEDYRPLVVGVHWPSLPWGDESLDEDLLGPADATEPLAAEDAAGAERLVDLYAERIADTPAARAALEVVAQHATADARLPGGRLPVPVVEAYATLFRESGLTPAEPGDAPGADVLGSGGDFDPDLVADGWRDAAAEAGGDPDLLGGGLFGGVKDAILAPARALSFWQMKNRARVVGESGVHRLLKRLQEAAGDGTRFHLMGHSFGCIVVTSAVAGPRTDGALVDAVTVDTLVLVQGALSAWTFASRTPFGARSPGYFRPLRDTRRVRGVTATTQTSHDTALRRLYPLGGAARRRRPADGGPVRGRRDVRAAGRRGARGR